MKPFWKYKYNSCPLNFLFLLLPLAIFPRSVLATNNSSLPSLDLCLQNSFSANFGYKGGLGVDHKISQNQCELKFVSFRGKGTKIELNLCSPEIAINTYPSIDSNAPTAISGGSYACPQNALFGADFSQKEGDLESFDKEKKHIQTLIQYALKFYGKETALPTTSGKLLCVKRLVENYLENCQILTSPESTEKSTPSDNPQKTESDIPGVRPQTIRKNH